MQIHSTTFLGERNLFLKVFSMQKVSSFITEFIAECISIHDPNAQEVNPQVLGLRDWL